MQTYWAEIEIDIAGDLQEIIGALLLGIGCQGWATTENAVKGYLPIDDRLEGLLLNLRENLNGLDWNPPPEITVRRVAEEDWATAWKQYFKPQRIGKRLVVRPTWETFDPQPNDLVILIDPGMAFGTGLHATTRLCLRALETHIQPGDTIADVGTGSGILAIGAVLLGAKSAVATDNDPLAVRIADENILVNRLTDRITAIVADLPPPGIFGVVVANILADVILGMREPLKAAVAPYGLLIVSGIIESRSMDVRDGLTAIGLTYLETHDEGEWVAILFRNQ